MKTEPQVIAKFIDANPFPSTDSFGLVAEEATEYLATLDARSSEVTQLKTREDRPSDRTRPVMPWLVAALVAVVAGVAIILMTNDAETPVATTPTTIAESAPTTLATPTTVADKLADYPNWVGTGPGTFRAAESPVPFAFTVPDGWSGHSDMTPDRLALCAARLEPTGGAGDVVCEFGMKAHVAILRLELGSIDETREYFATLDGAVLGDIADVVVGGAEGIRFTYENDVPVWPSDQTEPPFPKVATVTPHGGIPIGHGELGRSVITLVDVQGRTMTLVYQGNSQERGHPSDDFNNHFEEGMAIIDSIVWGDLS